MKHVTISHDSDCSLHNMPAYPNGPCDCALSEDVMDQKDNISLDDYAREERFAQARRMPTDD